MGVVQAVPVKVYDYYEPGQTVQVLNLNRPGRGEGRG